MLKRSFLKALILSSFFSMTGSYAAAQSEPRVLIIGDSISLGYTPYVQQSLAGQATVVHSPGNAQDTINGVKNLESWLGDGRWDVISFNFGLWDLCYRRPGPVTQENRDKVNGTIAVPLEEYQKNLEWIAKRIKSAGTKVVFQNVTVVPAGEPGRYSEDVERYNRAAAEVMKRLDIPVNDLKSITAALPDNLRESDTDVHYSDPGYARIAQSVIESIRQLL